MPAPSWSDIGLDIQPVLPVRIDKSISTNTKGFIILESTVCINPVMDRWNHEVLLDISVTLHASYDTSGLASALPDSKYRTMYFLDLKGLSNEGGYYFIEYMNSNDGVISGHKSNELTWTINTNSSNATGNVFITLKYLSSNVNFGYGELFPDFKSRVTRVLASPVGIEPTSVT